MAIFVVSARLFQITEFRGIHGGQSGRERRYRGTTETLCILTCAEVRRIEPEAFGGIRVWRNSNDALWKAEGSNLWLDSERDHCRDYG